MIWGKRQQIVLWITVYTPLLLVMVYRFIDAKDYFKRLSIFVWLADHIDKVLFDIVIISLIVITSMFFYKGIANYYLSHLKGKLETGQDGETVSVRKYEKLSVNEYSFFLLTLLVPLVSIDHTSVINLCISIFIIIFVMVIYVKTDYLVTCPVFFVSGYQVFKATLSYGTRQQEELNPSLKKEVVVITKLKRLDLSYKFRVIRLVSNIYYLAKKN